MDRAEPDRKVELERLELAAWMLIKERSSIHRESRLRAWSTTLWNYS